MKSRFIFNQTKNIFGSNILNMNPNTFKRLTSKSSLSSSLKFALGRINHQNLIIADQINNLGFLNINNTLNAINSLKEEIDLLKEEKSESLLDMIESCEKSLSCINPSIAIDVTNRKTIGSNI